MSVAGSAAGAHPGEWPVVERELTELVAAQDRAALAQYVQAAAAPLPKGSDPPRGCGGR